MRNGSDALKDVLTGSFTVEYDCDIFYGSTRVVAGLPIKSPQFKGNVQAATANTASVLVAYTPEFAESMTPEAFTDALAPFGAEANVQVTIMAGEGFREVVQLGRFRLSAVPKAYDEYMTFLGQKIVSGSLVELTLEDRSQIPRRWGFRVPESPASLASCWDEIGRISGAQLLRNVPDAPIPTSVVYEANAGGRWKAIQDLAGVLGGTALFNEFGVLTVVPDSPSLTPVVRLELGDKGTILDVDYSMDSEGVYNEVVGTFEDDDRNPIFAYASADGRLSPDGEYRPYTYYMSSPLVKTQAAADAAVRTRLVNLSSKQTYQLPVQCVYNPLVQLGDVVSVQRPNRVLVGRVMQLSHGDNGLMSLDLEVARPIP